MSSEPALEPLLRTIVPVETFRQDVLLTKATGFLFERERSLFLVTSRHVLCDEPSGHHPDRIEIVLHTDPGNLAVATAVSVPLYRSGTSLWRQGEDSSGGVDVALLPLDRHALPDPGLWCAFGPQHLRAPDHPTPIGSHLLIAGFPLGFGDTLHHVPVVRHAVLASPFGLRFKGEGYFLTDARTHRGSSGAPVVMRLPGGTAPALGELPWHVLGVHSGRLDMVTRDVQEDEALGLNCAWYVDMLMVLSEPSK